MYINSANAIAVATMCSGLCRWYEDNEPESIAIPDYENRILEQVQYSECFVADREETALRNTASDQSRSNTTSSLVHTILMLAQVTN